MMTVIKFHELYPHLASISFITFPSYKVEQVLPSDNDNSTKLNIMGEICNDTNYDSNMVYIQILQKLIQLLIMRQFPEAVPRVVHL